MAAGQHPPGAGRLAMNPLHFFARHGRATLIAGLLAGLLLPALAGALRPWLPQIVAVLLFLTAFRIGPQQAIGSMAQARWTLWLVLAFQLALPLAGLALMTALGVAQTPFGFALLLVLSSCSISGSPSFALMLGHDPAPALRLLILGTALLPLTVLPILWLSPSMGDPRAVLTAAARLLGVIALASATGFALRHAAFRTLTPKATRTVDGLTSLALAVIVIGLMSALGPALHTDPALVARWMLAAFATNFGLQISAFMILRRLGHPDPVGPAIVAGNRNMALFLVALPAATTDPLLIFIGCYQVPMYLTPILLKRLYAHD
ncbi:hypothetical protein [Thalassovita taeanensis]|uniref:Sodium Bile acid symporter family protein n=1 Tax=Thalassovita taeanensis TaxID=657014 RepID=A0A1H9AG55_9RHOB|nr:hypothetical protein [Thalassovita taeanensis]SEP75491.1 hypothetical protein SAMN04488092_102122 [Thalassovita taeanensis]